MEETTKRKKKDSRWNDVKLYMIGLGIYLGISLVVGLFLIKHFRHFWISHSKKPLTEYIITKADYDTEESREYDDDGDYVLHEYYTYYVLMDVKGKEYKVETSEKIYKRADQDKVTHFDTEEARFFYDGFRDQVFQGGYYPDYFYAFIVVFLLLFAIIFIVIPCSIRKKKTK